MSSRCFIPLRYNSGSVRPLSWTLAFAAFWLVSTLAFATVAAASAPNATGLFAQAQGSASKAHAPPARPLPDIRALLATVQKHQKAIDKRVENYTCTQTVEEDALRDHKQLKSRKTRTYHVFYIDGHEIDTLVARDGRPLSESQQARENQRSRKRIKKLEASARKKSASHDKDVGISTFLRTSRFTHPRWEQYRAHPVVVFDFAPNPSYKPKNLTERIAHSLEGVAWVDPQAKEVVRLQAWLGRPVKLAGGLLAKLDQGSAFAFEQAPMDNQLWMPSYLEADYSGREFLFKGLRGKVVFHYGDYKKFHVETVEKIAPVR
jgi:hypothetical protein